jgi:hypothetical protein
MLQADLTPTGKLRAGMNLENTLLAIAFPKSHDAGADYLRAFMDELHNEYRFE